VKAGRLFCQHLCLREAHDDLIRRLGIHTSVLSGQRNPFNLGHESLSVDSLGTLFLALIRALTERTIAFLTEESRELLPWVFLGLHIVGFWVGNKLVPELGHLLLPSLSFVSRTLEVHVV